MLCTTASKSWLIVNNPTYKGYEPMTDWKSLQNFSIMEEELNKIKAYENDLRNLDDLYKFRLRIKENYYIGKAVFEREKNRKSKTK
jgi:hypothetical protein